MTRTRVVTIAMLVAAAAAQAGPVFRTVVLSGAQAPGLPAGVTFGFLSDPRVNNAGQVLFFADLAGTGITSANDSSIWSDRAGSLALLYRKGDNSGQGPTTVWAAIPGPAFNSAGRVGFTGSLNDTAQANQPVNLAMFAEDASLALQKIAREGEAAPPPSTTNWLTLPQTNLSDGGLVPFGAAVVGTPGAWSAVPGQIPATIALSAAPAPGTAGLLFDFLDSPVTTGAGSLLLRGSARLSASPFTVVTSGLWTGDSNGLTLVASTDTQAPGTASNFAEFGIHPTINAQGRTAFWGRLLSAGVANDEGIWAGPTAGLSLAVREGDQAAGCPAGVVYRDMGRHPAISPAGAIAFSARLSGAGVDATNNSGIWNIAPGGGTALLAREGDQVGRLASGIVFGGFSEPVMNDAGQAAFLTRLSGAGVDSSNNQALLITDRTGRLYPLFRTGQLFDTGTGPPRIIDEIIFDSGPAQSGRSQFADTSAGGTLICKLVFHDPAALPASAYSSAIVTASLRCLTDFDGSGSLTANDFIGFLNGFAARDLLACDFAGNGVLDVNDFIGFLNATVAPCP